MIVDLIHVSDPKMERLTDQIGAKIASILQKPESEMQMMLRRTYFMNKRKEKKTDMEKTQQIIKQLIEKKLVESNAQPGVTAASLQELMPNFILNLPEQEQSVVKNFLKDVETFIQISNKYFVYKS